MGFQWLTMRIQEEQDRRKKQAAIRERLPQALAESYDCLKTCVDAYKAAFGNESADIALNGDRIEATVRERRDGAWLQRAEIVVETLVSPPGFRINCGDEATEIQVGLLPGDRLYYKYGEQYLTMEQLTKLVLDRAFFPKLGE